MNPFEKGMNILRERERELYLIVKISTLTVNKKSLLGSTRGRVYIESLLLSFTLVLSILFFITCNHLSIAIDS